MLKALAIVASIFGLHIQAMDQGNPDPYQYKDESTIRDKRKIAVLAYGSLVKNPAPTGADRRPALKIVHQFQPTTITLPVALSRKSSGDRVTAVVDNTLGEPKRVYFATSAFQSLPNARNNLAGREGVKFTNQSYSLDNIFYMKKRLANRAPDANEKEVPGTQWVIRTNGGERVVLRDEKAKEIAAWADQNGFQAVIWASFPPTMAANKDVAEALLGNSTLLSNTKGYVDILPDGAQTRLEKAISQENRDELTRIARGQ